MCMRSCVCEREMCSALPASPWYGARIKLLYPRRLRRGASRSGAADLFCRAERTCGGSAPRWWPSPKSGYGYARAVGGLSSASAHKPRSAAGGSPRRGDRYQPRRNSEVWFTVPCTERAYTGAHCGGWVTHHHQSPRVATYRHTSPHSATYREKSHPYMCLSGPWPRARSGRR